MTVAAAKKIEAQNKAEARMAEIAASREVGLPTGWTKVEYPEADAVVYLYSNPNGTVGYKLFVAKRTKAKEFYRFPSEENRAKYLARSIERLTAAKTASDERKAKEKAEVIDNSFQVGDIMYCSWGYSMTIIDFYVVVSKTKCKVTVRRIADRVVSGDSQVGTCAPLMPVEMIGDPIRATVTGKETAKFDRRYLYKWDGNPKGHNHMD